MLDRTQQDLTTTDLLTAISNTLRASPKLEHAFRAMYAAVFERSNALVLLELAAIALAVSVGNGSHAGIYHFVKMLRDAGGSEPLIVSLLLGEEPDDESERIKRLVYYARKVTLLPNSMGEKDLTELLESRFSDSEILHTVNVAAFVNYVNRLAEGLATNPEH